MDHVEECPSYYVDCLGTICDCDYMHICMCRELRACEQRVLATAVQRVEDMPDWSTTYVSRVEVIAAIKRDQ